MEGEIHTRSFSEAALSDLKLSDTISSGIPRLLINLRKLRKKASVFILGVSCECIALVTAHVYSAFHHAIENAGNQNTGKPLCIEITSWLVSAYDFYARVAEYMIKIVQAN